MYLSVVEANSQWPGTKVFKHSNCKIKLDETLGSGDAMNVYEGTCRINGVEKPVAIKCPRQFSNRTLHLNSRDRKNIYAGLEKEIEYMKRMKDQENVVQFYGLVMKNGDYQRPMLVLELATCDLEEYLQNQTHTVDSNRMLDFCRQIANGVQAMHNARIIHGDLKGSNILVFEKDDGTVALKLSDFGYSSSLSSSTGRAGKTIQFTAPECLPDAQHHPKLRKYYNTSALLYNPNLQLRDIYSYGLVVWQIVMKGQVPFSHLGKDDIIKIKMSGNLDHLLIELPESTPILLRSIIKGTTKFRPDERIKFPQLMDVWSLSTSSIVEDFYPEIRSASHSVFNIYESDEDIFFHVQCLAAIRQVRRAAYEKDPFLWNLVIFFTAIFLIFSIVLVHEVKSGIPSMVKGYKIAHVIISIGCLTTTACNFLNSWVVEQFNPFLRRNRKTTLTQAIALIFLGVKFSMALNDLQTRTETFHLTFLDAIFLWGCINSTLTAIITQDSQKLYNGAASQKQSESIYSDVQGSLVEFFLPLLMLISAILRDS